MEERFKSEERKEILGEEWRKISRIFDRLDYKYGAFLRLYWMEFMTKESVQVSVDCIHSQLHNSDSLLHHDVPALSSVGWRPQWRRRLWSAWRVDGAWFNLLWFLSWQLSWQWLHIHHQSRLTTTNDVKDSKITNMLKCIAPLSKYITDITVHYSYCLCLLRSFISIEWPVTSNIDISR